MTGLPRGSRLLLGAVLTAFIPDPAAGQADPGAALARCRSIPDNAARLRCYEAAAPPGPQVKLPPLLEGGWRLVRTQGPPGEKDAVSIMHTADIARSDVGLAGLTVRCAEHGTQTLVVLVTPLPPRARPQVTLRAAGKEARVAATVMPPGAALLLPPEADALVAGAGPAEPELALEVVTDEATTRGVIPLTGLRAATQALAATCPAR